MLCIITYYVYNIYDIKPRKFRVSEIKFILTISLKKYETWGFLMSQRISSFLAIRYMIYKENVVETYFLFKYYAVNYYIRRKLHKN